MRMSEDGSEQVPSGRERTVGGESGARSRKAAPAKDCLDRIAELLEADVQALAHYRELLQFGLT
jgi:hypothetical protein